MKMVETFVKVLYNKDFKKAYDSVRWEVLYNLELRHLRCVT